ncbi:MFS transporter [bacterium]|nr:MFS transporter [Rubripirellula sp.]MDB4338488.1 MFS transporter [Rubripirellula sp.]MDB4809733.1 MFS transporter [bacterium]
MYDFFKRNFRWLAGGFLLTYFSSFGQTFFLSSSVGQWQSQFELSHGEFGRLYMLATLASALCLPFLGRLVDLMPESRMVLTVIPALALATFLAANATSAMMLAVAIFLLRLFGQGMMTHLALTATGRWFEQQRGRAISIVVLGHQGGEATLPLLFTSVVTVHGFQAGWTLGAVSLLLIGLPLAYWAYHRPRDPQQQEENSETLLPELRSWTRSEVLCDPLFWILLFGVLAPPFIGTTIFYHQVYLTDLNDWPPRMYALSLSVMAGTTVACALGSGALIDRFRATSVLPFFLLPLAATCFVLSRGGPTSTLLIVMVLIGISYGCSSTLFGAIWPEVYGTLHLGAIRSVIVSFMVFATAAGPGLTGTLIDRGIPLPTQMHWAGFYCLFATLIVGIASLKLKKRRTHAGAASTS